MKSLYSYVEYARLIRWSDSKRELIYIAEFLDGDRLQFPAPLWRLLVTQLSEKFTEITIFKN